MSDVFLDTNSGADKRTTIRTSQKYGSYYRRERTLHADNGGYLYWGIFVLTVPCLLSIPPVNLPLLNHPNHGSSLLWSDIRQLASNNVSSGSRACCLLLAEGYYITF